MTATATAGVMQISPADLAGMMRADAISLVSGAILVVVGLLALGFLPTARPRLMTQLWFGIFSLLYGLRLLVRTTMFRLCVDDDRVVGLVLR